MAIEEALQDRRRFRAAHSFKDARAGNLAARKLTSFSFPAIVPTILSEAAVVSPAASPE
jgi:hypothetical protein